MAAALLARRLDHAGTSSDVTSAGLLYEGRPASDGAVAAMRTRGIDIAAHRSRTLNAALVEAADLIIGMEPRHVREAVALSDSAWERAFTLRELARRSASVAPREGDHGFAEWLAKMGRGRRRIDLLADDNELAVLDPYHQNQAVYDATAADIEAELGRIVAAAWPGAHQISDDLVPTERIAL
jgi:protein-tyrosine phosphatase